MFSSLTHFYQSFFHLERKIHLYLAGIGVGTGWIVFGLVLLMLTGRNRVEIPAEQLRAPELTPDIVMVDVSGAVKNPGVYQLTRDARVAEAVSAAGGLAENVDQQALNETLNLAAKVDDGQKLYIPVTRPIQASVIADSFSEPVIFTTTLISINKASAEELETLPGIGEKKASDIIAGRPYSSVDDIKTVAKLSDAQWTEVKKLLSL